MRADCSEFRRLHRREVAGELSGRDFRRLDRHRAACAGCAELARQEDPLALFRPLAADRRDEAFWVGLNEAIRAGIREEGRLGPGETLRLLRPAYRVALAAVLVVIVGALALVLPPALEGPGGGEATGAPEVLFTGSAPGAVTLPTVESIRSPEATVYEMKVFGEGEQVAELVMIFDEGIDL
jgi:hypothetical protein